VKITGAADEIIRFKQTCIINDCLDFNTIIPMPAAVQDSKDAVGETGRPVWDEWSCANWGTKWNAHAFCLGKDETNHLECSFETAWSPPVPIWEKMGEMFPTLVFDLSGCVAEDDLALRGTIRDGKLELHDEPLEWETVDPKTGKTVVGSREEIERVLGKNGGFVVYRHY